MSRAESDKNLYESLDALASGGDERLAEALIKILGLRWSRGDRSHRAHWARDPDAEASARVACTRWLRDHGYVD
jgi:hypothetical protein